MHNHSKRMSAWASLRDRVLTITVFGILVIDCVAPRSNSPETRRSPMATASAAQAPAVSVAATAPTTPAAVPDRDGDGVTDAEDCCPDASAREVIPSRKIRTGGGTRRDIVFGEGSATPEPQSSGATAEDILQQVVEALQQYPELRLIRIIGHADSRERDRMALSLRRAEWVRDWLVGHRIDPSRLEVQAAGAERPMAPSDTADHRARNRRVEFEIAERDEISESQLDCAGCNPPGCPRATLCITEQVD
jgi:outer membrane protein OmpA-like peptidoglycan-associated protein